MSLENNIDLRFKKHIIAVVYRATMPYPIRHVWSTISLEDFQKGVDFFWESYYEIYGSEPDDTVAFFETDDRGRCDISEFIEKLEKMADDYYSKGEQK